MSESPNIFDWLDQVRKRPSMYMHSIKDLHWQVLGYYTGLRLRKIHEDVPCMVGHFSDWMYATTKWSGFNCGWGYAFEHNTSDKEEAIQCFFKYVDQYRQFKPVVTASVILRPEHQPLTDRWWFVGDEERKVRPDEIFVVNYRPSEFSHLRYRFGEYYVNDPLHRIGKRYSFKQQSDLFERPFKEFGIEPAEWEILD